MGDGGEDKEKRNKRDGEEVVAGYLTECEISHITVHSGHYPQKHTQVGGGKVKMGWEEWEGGKEGLNNNKKKKFKKKSWCYHLVGYAACVK